MTTQPKTYIQDSNNLYIYTPSSNAYSVIGATGSLLTDIAVLNNGTAYGVDFSSLYSVNTSTGHASFLKSLPRNDINALGVDSNGQLYVAGGYSSTVYKLNVETGTMIPFATASAGSNGDLIVFNGKLWLATSAKTLESFDMISGAKIDSIYHGINDIFGLSISETGQMYGFSDTKAYVLDLGTGAATEVATFPIGLSIYGASPAASDWQQWYLGSSISDFLTSTNGNDFLAGLDGNDTLNGLLGNDHLIGGKGNDTIDGASGIDTAVFTGTRADHTVIKTSTGWTVASPADGTDTINNIERLQFSNEILALDIDGNAGQAYRIYQAAFNRTPDNGGLKYWIERMDTGTNLERVAAEFVGSQEFQTQYGSNPTNANFLTTLYSNVLHRTPDQGGYDWWLGELNAGRYTTVSALASFAESAENQAGVIGVIQNGIELFA